MQRLYAWAMPVYALAITFLVFFQGWPVQPQSAAQQQILATSTIAASNAVPLPAEATAANHAGYPIPAPAKSPKHLFHLILRYEGDGLIDQNAVDVCKSCGLMQADQKETKKAPEKPAAPKSAGSNLFQFIVRYEGDGIIDNNVVDFFKAYLTAQNNQEEEGNKSEERPPMTTPTASKPSNAPQR